jgi:hypothetical protein
LRRAVAWPGCFSSRARLGWLVPLQERDSFGVRACRIDGGGKDEDQGKGHGGRGPRPF